MHRIETPMAKERYSVKIVATFASLALVSACAFPVAALAESGSSQSSSAQSMQEPPEKPSGEDGSASMGEAPDKPDGEGGPGGMGGGMGGANTQSFDYSGSYSATTTADGTEERIEGETVSASESLTNAALAQNGGTLYVADSTLQKSGDASDGDACNFYGVNAIALAVGEGSLLSLSDSTLTADSEGSNGVFATDGATAYVYSTSIATSADNSRGLDATYGGTIIAASVNAETQGNHCAGIATDRGGGYVSANNSSFETNGSGSPVLYSTGCIEVDSINGAATGSQIAGMEGLNTILIENSTLSSTITDKTASDPIANGIIIYQSTSGDAETSTGERALFQAVDSTLSSAIQSGAMFYVTNTQANIVLSNTSLDFDSNAANLLTIAGNDSNNWGKSGSNGGTVALTAIQQTLTGNIDVDAISSLDLYLTDNSAYTGAINQVENASGATGAGDIDVVLDATSTWVVTGDSTLSSLAVAEGAQVVDENGDAVSIVADGSTVVSGSSAYTITVSGSYSTDADLSGAAEISEQSIDRSAFNSSFGIQDSEDDATAASAASSADSYAGSASSADSSSTNEEGGFFAWIANLWRQLTGA